MSCEFGRKGQKGGGGTSAEDRPRRETGLTGIESDTSQILTSYTKTTPSA